MPKWRHKTLKVVIQTESVLGGQWEKIVSGEKLVEPEKKVVSIDVVKPKEPPAVESGELADITIKDIKQELDAMGIEYNPRAKKQELYDLMMGK